MTQNGGYVVIMKSNELEIVSNGACARVQLISCIAPYLEKSRSNFRFGNGFESIQSAKDYRF